LYPTKVYPQVTTLRFTLQHQILIVPD